MKVMSWFMLIRLKPPCHSMVMLQKTLSLFLLKWKSIVDINKCKCWHGNINCRLPFYLLDGIRDVTGQNWLMAYALPVWLVLNRAFWTMVFRSIGQTSDPWVEKSLPDWPVSWPVTSLDGIHKGHSWIYIWKIKISTIQRTTFTFV